MTHLQDNHLRHELILEHFHVAFDESDVEETEEVVDELEHDQFIDAMSLKLRLCSMIFFNRQKCCEAIIKYGECSDED